MTLAYVQRGLEHWERYASRRFEMHPELLNTYAGHWNLREPKGTRQPRRDISLKRKRIESATVTQRLHDLWLFNHDAATKEVGIVDAAGERRPFRLSEMAERCMCSVAAVKNLMRRARRNAWIHRHQAREHDPSNKERPFKGKVARLWLTDAFLQASRCAGMRRQHLEKARKRRTREARKLERQKLAERLEFEAFSKDLAHQLSEGLWEKFEREVMSEHPDWVLGRQFTRIREAVQWKVAEWRQRRPKPRT